MVSKDQTGVQETIKNSILKSASEYYKPGRRECTLRENVLCHFAWIGRIRNEKQVSKC
jgi:hypothetical protein